jgi:hypothetical protein
MDPSTPTTGARRLRLLAVPLLAVLVAASAYVVLGRASDEAAPAVMTTTTTAPTTSTTTTAPTTTTTTYREPAPPVSTVTATPKGKVAKYDAPDGPMTGTVDNLYYGNPTTLPVIEEAPGGWLHVRTPYKPNGSTAWIRAADAVLGSTPWAIQIDVTTTHLRLYEDGQLVVDAAVGIGTDATPTAQGDFFVTFLQAPPSSMYGPFVMITTGHSDVIQSWDGFPDGILGIHGPINADSWIGDTGSRISNGCVRMHVVDQQKLAGVTPGTPVHIYASPPAA